MTSVKITLNESPSEKEGKIVSSFTHKDGDTWPSMKVPPKRKGKRVKLDGENDELNPQ